MAEIKDPIQFIEAILKANKITGYTHESEELTDIKHTFIKDEIIEDEKVIEPKKHLEVFLFSDKVKINFYVNGSRKNTEWFQSPKGDKFLSNHEVDKRERRKNLDEELEAKHKEQEDAALAAKKALKA